MLVAPRPVQDFVSRHVLVGALLAAELHLKALHVRVTALVGVTPIALEGVIALAQLHVSEVV